VSNEFVKNESIPLRNPKAGGVWYKTFHYEKNFAKESGERRNEETTAQLTHDARAKPIIADFLLALLIASVVFLRVVKLDSVPPGTDVDEASIGYNAYSILQTGADEHGVSFPLFFKAFGEYKNPVFIYSLVPLIKAFDLSIWTIRFGAALFGLGTAIFLALIVKETIGGIRPAHLVLC
jgi:hypothetical protein